MNEIALEILRASHLEHFKAAKDLSLILPLEHPKRLAIEKELNRLVLEMEKIQHDKNS